MNLPVHDLGPMGQAVSVHEPDADDHEPRTRWPLLFWDRVRILVLLSVIFGMSVAIKHDNVPIMSWREALDDQARSKWWLFVLGGFELLHQLHLFVCERVGGYNQLWEKHVWGRWDRAMDKLNPWTRFRLGRMVKVVAWGSVALLGFSAMWGVSFLEALAQAPGRLWSNPFGDAGMPWFFQIFFALAFGIIQIGGMYWFLSKGGIDTYMPRDIKTRFRDVWGQDKVLDKIKENILFLEKPGEIESKGGHVPGGMLLWGPPGTGKTLMAEAVAGETGKPYVFVDPGAFIQMFMGIGPLKVKRLFTKLRKLSLRYGGVIVFFDEADTLGNRGQLSGGFNKITPAEASAAAQLQCCNGLHYVGQNTANAAFAETVNSHRGTRADVNEPLSLIRRPLNIIMAGGGGGSGVLQSLLTEMSGLKKPRGAVSRRLRSLLNMKPKPPPKYRILIMMATNMPSALDEAMLRPGRIDRKYKVDFPTLEGRIRTFDGYFKKVRHSLSEDQVHRLAVMSPRATGASIKDIVNESLIVAIRDGRDTVTWPDVLEAKTFKLWGMADGVAATELEQHETAIHEAAHAVAFYFLSRRSVIDIATIEQRGDVGGFVSPVPIEERKFDWRTEMELDVMVALASLVAERMFFGGDNSVGVGGDMRTATSTVRGMLSRAAMGESLTSHGAGDDLSDNQRHEFDLRVEAKLQELYQRTYELIDANRWFLAAIAHALQQHHTISGEDIDAIYKGHVGPTLDGSVYRSDGFLEQYGAYLASAKEAHEAQGQIRMLMPTFGVGPVLSGVTPGGAAPGGSSHPAYGPGVPYRPVSPPEGQDSHRPNGPQNPPTGVNATPAD